MRKVSLFLLSILILTFIFIPTSLSLAQAERMPGMQMDQSAQPSDQPPAIPAGRGGAEEHPKPVEVPADNSLMAIIAVSVFLTPAAIYALARSRRKTQQLQKSNVKK